MQREEPSLDELIGLLSHRSQAQRRRAAKRLRRLGDPLAGPALLAALEREIPGDIPPEETWETQYQLVTALGECTYRPAEKALRRLACLPFAATMVYVALGDAIVRLGDHPANDADPAFWCLDTAIRELGDGAFRATAMLRLVYPEDVTSRLLDYVADLAGVEPFATWRFWPAAAAAGWSGRAVEAFLRDCLDSPRNDVRDAATASLAGRYKRWHPL